MAEKKTRILKKEWKSFLKDFNRMNQYRRAVVQIGDDYIVGEPGMPLLGIDYDDRARRVEIFLGTTDPDNLVHLAHAVDVPRAIYLIKDEEAPNPVVGLQVQGAPGTGMTRIVFVDTECEDGRQKWVAAVAHTLYERRGMEPGADQEDWFRAERIIEAVCKKYRKD